MENRFSFKQDSFYTPQSKINNQSQINQSSAHLSYLSSNNQSIINIQQQTVQKSITLSSKNQNYLNQSEKQKTLVFQENEKRCINIMHGASQEFCIICKIFLCEKCKLNHDQQFSHLKADYYSINEKIKNEINLMQNDIKLSLETYQNLKKQYQFEFQQIISKIKKLKSILTKQIDNYSKNLIKYVTKNFENDNQILSIGKQIESIFQAVSTTDILTKYDIENFCQQNLFEKFKNNQDDLKKFQPSKLEINISSSIPEQLQKLLQQKVQISQIPKNKKQNITPLSIKKKLTYLYCPEKSCFLQITPPKTIERINYINPSFKLPLYANIHSKITEIFLISLTCTNHVIYNLKNQNFEQFPIQLKRKHFASTQNENCIYIIGGINENDLVSPECNFIKDNQIHKIKSIKHARYSASTIYHQNRLFVFGGLNYSGLVQSIEFYFDEKWDIFNCIGWMPKYMSYICAENNQILLLGGLEKKEKYFVQLEQMKQLLQIYKIIKFINKIKFYQSQFLEMDGSKALQYSEEVFGQLVIQ